MIRINNVLYDAIPVNAEDGSMSITFSNSSLSLGEVETIFLSDPKIEILEGDEVIGTYYNKEIRSLNIRYLDGVRDIIAYLIVTAVAEDIVAILNAQIDKLKSDLVEVQESADVSDGAISELATMAADSQTDRDTINDAIQDLANTVGELYETVQTLTDSKNTDETDIPKTDESTGTTTEETISDSNIESEA